MCYICVKLHSPSKLTPEITFSKCDRPILSFPSVTPSIHLVHSMAENSCCKWKEILSKNLPRKCPANCFNPLNGPCPDYKIVDVVNREASVVKAILEPEPPIRRIIDTKALCSKCCGLAENTPEKCCNLCDAQNATQRNNLCSAACRPLGTKLHLQEVCTPAQTRSLYN